MEFEKNDYDKCVELFHLYGEDSSLYEVFYTNDYPIPYKKLKIYPVRVSLYRYFHMLVDCLLRPHLTSGDINAISKSYFEYLIYLAEEKNEKECIGQLVNLLSICLDIPFKDEKGHLNIDIVKDNNKWLLRICNEVYDSKDFDVLRKIICEQNAIEMPDEVTHPDIVKAFKDVEEYRRKVSNFKICDFEDQINVVAIKTGYKREDCLKMTIRSFTRMFNRLNKIENYEVYTPLTPYMDSKKGEKVEHFLAADKTREERYRDSMVDQEMQNNKIVKNG